MVEEKLVRETFKKTAGADLEVDAYSLRLVLDDRFNSGVILHSCPRNDWFMIYERLRFNSLGIIYCTTIL